MNEINTVLRAAAWRVGASLFLRGLVFGLAAALSTIILIRFAEQFLGLALRWTPIVWAAGGVSIVVAVVFAIARRPDRLAVARRVDEGANLKESLSTALCVAPAAADNPWARVTIDQAARQARGVRLSAAVPIEGPRFWPVVVALALACAIVFLAVPRVDLLGWQKQRTAKVEREAQIVQARADAIDAKQKVEEMVKDLDLKDDAKAEAAPDKPEAKDPEAIRKAAIKDLSKLSDRLQELRSGEKAQKLDALAQSLKQLKTPGAETNELSKALATGDFKQAQQELEKLKDALAGKDSKLSDADKEKLAKQLDDIAKQLEKMAKDKEGLEKQLEKMGLDKSLAKDPDALNKALKQAENLTEAQKQQLAEMAKACQNSGESCQGLSQAMSKMAEAAQAGDPQSLQEAAQGANGQLSDLEQIAMEMQTADAALSECKSQMSQLAGQCDGSGQGQGDQPGDGGTKPWSEGWNTSQSNGSGGPGIANGGGPGAQKADFETQKKKSLSPLGQGPIVGSRMVEGESIKGESKAEFAQAVAAADQNATEAIENHTIPREFHDAVKSYFGRLKREAGGAPAGASGAGNTKPASDAKPAQPAAAPDASKK